MQWISQGGFFMIPLLCCSVIMLAVIIERILLFSTVMRQPLSRSENPEATIMKLRRRLPSLHTIITISPMLGLLGTVSGLMKCFHLLGGNIVLYNPREMSRGIGEALITTEAGLLIAVIAVVAYNSFTSSLESYVSDYNRAIKDERSDGAAQGYGRDCRI